MIRHPGRLSLGFLAAAMSAVALGVIAAEQAPPPSAGGAKPAASAKPWTPGKTIYGEPDLQGMWLNFDSTPFEAPLVAPRGGGGGGGGGGFGFFPDVPAAVTARRSLVVEPADGRVPVMPWAEKKRADDLARLGDSWEHHTTWERCITRAVPGGMFPTGYNSAYQIIQGPKQVVILYEMLHEPRVIPIDGGPHLPKNVRLWNGDSRGRWEGNTLVVDITNYTDRGQIANNAGSGRLKGIPQSEDLHVVERFTRVAENTINYEVTITDPKVYTQPWKLAIPLTRNDEYVQFEYACHEGNENYMRSALGGGRLQEQASGQR